MPFDFSFEDSGSEDGGLEGVLRELGRVLPGSAEINWAESRGRCREVLGEVIGQSRKSRRLIELFEGAPYFVGGDEHHVVRVETDTQRIYKFTHGDNFGCRSFFSPFDPELRGHFHGETNADPFFYLRRWQLLNQIGGYQTRFEGFLPAEKPEWLPRICISQPELGGTNPTPQEIREALAKYGFAEVSISAFFEPDSGLLLTDCAPRNVRIVDGIPVPFDAIAQIASGRIAAWCKEQVANP
jgi:hypothetical protein